MKKILIAAALMLTVAAFGATKDDFAGFYKGEVLDKIPYPFGAEREIFAEVYRGPNQTYRVKFVQDIFRRAEEHAVFDGLKAKDGKITVKGGQGMTFKDVDCEITPEEITATFKAGNKKAKMHLKRLNYVSPTMGKKPLEGAVVLFDGKDTSQWTLQDGSPCNWEIKDGAMLVKTDAKDAKGKRKNSSIVSKEKFGHCYLHLEFKVPAMYENLGQARANSGVIFFNKYYYEIQILDSFGTPAFWNECGSLYRQVPPQMNASLEPETWQTYDIEYALYRLPQRRARSGNDAFELAHELWPDQGGRQKRLQGLFEGSHADNASRPWQPGNVQKYLGQEARLIKIYHFYFSQKARRKIDAFFFAAEIANFKCILT